MKRRGGNPPEEYRFKPGQSGNSKGRPLNPIKNALRKLTVQQYRRIIKSCVKGNLDELKRVIKNPLSSALEVGIAACYVKAVETGDYSTIEKMLERVVGKVPEEINVNSKNQNLNLNVNKKIDSTLVKEAIKELEGEV